MKTNGNIQQDLFPDTGSPPVPIEYRTHSGLLFDRKWKGTPWGSPDRIESVAPGIDHYATPSHGGFYVAVQRNLQVDPAWRQVSGWYEEDSESAILIFTFRRAFRIKWGDLRRAVRSLKYFYGSEYTKVTGRPVPFEKTFESKVQRLPDGTTKRREDPEHGQSSRHSRTRGPKA